MTTYSAFFSSGLLAPPQSYPSYYSTSRSPIPSSPCPSSPAAIPAGDDLDIDIDRSTTPTPSYHSSNEAPSTRVNVNMPTNSTTRPRLRKRRSSLTVGANPISNIKSPVRSAGAALRLAALSPGARTRSGSLNAGPGIAEDDVFGSFASAVGRMRSGSVGGVPRPRRAVRYIPAALAPPPTAPLPALPPNSHPRAPLRAPALNSQLNGGALARSVSAKLTVEEGEMGEGAERDEEMKEN